MSEAADIEQIESELTLGGRMSAAWNGLMGKFSDAVDTASAAGELLGNEEYGADAQRLVNRLESDGPLKESLQDVLGQEGGSKLEMINQLQQLAEYNPDMFAQLNNILDKPDSAALLENIGQQPALQQMLLNNPAGQDMDPAQADQALAQMPARLDALSTQDPAVFTKLNDIVEADGADAFFERVAADPSMSEAFQVMLYGGDSQAVESAGAINRLHGELQNNPALFNDLNNFAESQPKMFGMGMGLMAHDPDAAFEMMGGAQQMGQFWSMMQDMLPPEFMEAIEGIISAIAPGLNNMLEKIGFEDIDLGSMFASNNNGELTRAAAGVEAGANADAGLNENQRNIVNQGLMGGPS